jgi:hypothetical protein
MAKIIYMIPTLMLIGNTDAARAEEISKLVTRVERDVNVPYVVIEN